MATLDSKKLENRAHRKISDATSCPALALRLEVGRARHGDSLTL
jgi:hypothetical protein